MQACATVCRDLTLSPEAMDAIGDFYTELRSSSGERALPVTVRTLESIIRLATGAAKARLAESHVAVQDVEVAKELMLMVCVLHQVPILTRSCQGLPGPVACGRPRCESCQGAHAHGMCFTASTRVQLPLAYFPKYAPGQFGYACIHTSEGKK